jgi:hypothetical protein
MGSARNAACMQKGKLVSKGLLIVVGLLQAWITTLEAARTHMGMRGAGELGAHNLALGARIALLCVNNTKLPIVWNNLHGSMEAPCPWLFRH